MAVGDQDFAASLLRTASLRLAGDCPFHARLLARFTLSPTTTTASIRVRVRGLGFDVGYDPAFVTKLSVENCEALLLHVLNHVIFGHLVMDEAQFPNAVALEVAQDITANEWVSGRHLPPGSITLAQFPTFPEEEDTATRYHRLCELPPDELDSMHPVDDHGEPEEEGGGEEEGAAEDDDTEERERFESLLRADVRAALDGLDETQVARIPDVLRRAIRDLTNREPGSVSGDTRTELLGRGARLDWRKALRHYLASLNEREPSYSRPSRRAPTLVGIVPGSARRPSKHRIVVAIDTSSSMSDGQLNVIAAELRVLARRADVFVIECDTEIKAAYEFRGKLVEVCGRGGTDLRPPFATAAKMRPDLFVYFTDGCGPAPARAPRFKTIWCLTYGGQRPAPWGRVVHMQDAE